MKTQLSYLLVAPVVLVAGVAASSNGLWIIDVLGVLLGLLASLIDGKGP